MNEAAPTVPRAGTEIKFTERQIRNFWLKVDKEGPLPDQTNPHYAGLDRCWVWTDHKHKRGYGCFRIGRKMVKTHRAVWIITHGAIPQNLCVMHRCDQTSCCRPDHLQLGTHTDNMHDMAAKGRNRQQSGDRNGSRLHPESRPRGEANYNAKLTSDQVVEIRALYARGKVTYAMLGARFGVHKSVICKIIHRELWAHVQDDWV